MAYIVANSKLVHALLGAILHLDSGIGREALGV